MKAAPVLVALCLLALFGVSLPARQQAPIRSAARTVAVYATVTDAQGRLVPDLSREAFEIYDNGKLQATTVFSNDIQPITVVMMLDRSGSMRGNFGLVQAAGEAFVRKLLPADKARIGSFADKVEMHPEGFTSDQAVLIGILRTKLQAEGPTPLWNAVDAAIENLKTQDGRRVVLVFSDGADNPANFKFNNKSFLDIMRRAQEADVMVYAVGLEGTQRPSFGGGGGVGGFGQSNRPDPGLAAIADETGGGYFELRRAEDLSATFARVADELHRQYLIGFAPAQLDGKMHKLQLRANRPGAKVRARKEYFAAK